MKAGWRVRRSHARRRDRLLQDWNPFGLDSSPSRLATSPSTFGAEARANAGAVQADRADQALQPPQGKYEKARGRRAWASCVSDVSLHEPQNSLDCLDCLDGASNGAGFPQSKRGLTAGPLGLPSWTRDQRWIAEIVRAESGDPKLAVLFRWVIAAGGWIEGTTALLPKLPAGLARNELHRLLRQHGIDVCASTS